MVIEDKEKYLDYHKDLKNWLFTSKLIRRYISIIRIQYNDYITLKTDNKKIYYESIEEIPVTLYDDNYKFWTSYEYNPKKSLLNIEFSIIGYKNARLLFSIALLKHRRELEPIYWENK